MLKKTALFVEGLVLLAMRYRMWLVAGLILLLALSTYVVIHDPVLMASVRDFAVRVVPKYLRLGSDLLARALAKREFKRFFLMLGSWTVGAWVRRTFRRSGRRMRLWWATAHKHWLGLPAWFRWCVTGTLVVVPLGIVLFAIFGWWSIIFIPWDVLKRTVRYLLGWLFGRLGLGQLAERLRLFDRLATWLVPLEMRLAYRRAVRGYARRVIRRRRIATRRTVAHATMVRQKWVRRKALRTERKLARRAKILAHAARARQRSVWDTKIYPALKPWFGSTSIFAELWTRGRPQQ